MNPPTSRIALHALALTGLLAGCATAPVAPSVATPESAPAAPVAAPAADNSHREREIRAVMAMRERGEIGDAQALRLIALLNGVPLADPVTPPAGASQPKPAESPAAVGTTQSTPAALVTPVQVDSGYKPGARVTGRLRSVGSDSLDRVMERWAKGFVKVHPDVRASHEGKGSSTAVPALLEGRADFAPMSRPLKAEEIARFETRFGYAPTPIRTAVDALAVFVHPANPLAGKGLTLRQIDAAFSATRKRGGKEAVTWGDLGATGEWKAAPIRAYSRNSASGTYGFFLDEVLQKGEFRDDTRFLAGSAELVAAVAADKFAIGYSGIGYKSPAVAALAVAADETAAPVVPGEVQAVTGAYPIARSLYVVLNRKPGEAASDLQREFITYALSPQGQGDVAAEGYFPLPVKDRAIEVAKLRYNAE